MAEETIWRGSVSQRKNFGFFVLQMLLATAIVIIFVLTSRSSSPEIRNFSAYMLILLAVPIFIAGQRYLQTKCKVYQLTSERLKTIACAALKTSNSTLQIPLRRSFSSKRSGIMSAWRTKFEIKSKPFVSKKVFAKSTSSEPWPSGRLWLQIIQTFRQII